MKCKLMKLIGSLPHVSFVLPHTNSLKNISEKTIDVKRKISKRILLSLEMRSLHFESHLVYHLSHLHKNTRMWITYLI